MSAADSYAASFAYFQGVPGFAANAKSDYATDAFARVQASNAQVEAALARDALAGKYSLAAQESVNKASLDLAKLNRKPTLAQKLTALAGLGGAVGSNASARNATAVALLNQAGAYRGGGLERGNSALVGAQTLAGNADIYGESTRRGAQELGKTINLISPPAVSEFTPGPAPAPVTPTQQAPSYGFSGAQAPQVPVFGEDAYRNWLKSKLPSRA